MAWNLRRILRKGKERDPRDAVAAMNAGDTPALRRSIAMLRKLGLKDAAIVVELRKLGVSESLIAQEVQGGD